MSISYEKKAKKMLRDLNDLFVDGRENEQIPIYLTKYRIKKENSIYLKMKRKGFEQFEQITDYAGLRVLCLFEKDILEVHEYILKIFSKQQGTYKLTEFEIYNWTNDVYINKLETTTNYSFPSLDIIQSTKDSGYKSLHYLVSYTLPDFTCSIEIQLKTLLQDVWSELEHTLSYKKGNIHPHIKKSFSLLARDLETNDKLLTHLRDISDKESRAEQFFVKKDGPTTYFGYEKDKIPKAFKDPNIQLLWNTYTDFVQDVFKMKEMPEGWVSKARDYYVKFFEKVGGLTISDKKVEYILKIEEAFLVFSDRDSDRDYEKALNIYNDLSKNKNYKNHYVVHFRKGELLFIKGKIEEALPCFDQAEELIQKGADSLNKYIIKTMLAYVYWSLGTDYIDIAVSEIDDAELACNSELSKAHPDEYFKLLNNTAWYYLEQYIIIKERKKSEIDKEKNEKRKKKLELELEESYKIVEKKCLAVEAILDNDPTCHRYDTVMWFYHQKYLKDKKISDSERAQKYCDEIREAVDYNSLTFSSWSLFMNHIQEIMAEKKTTGNEKV